MTYEETLDYLFNRLQSFHNDGATAYKPGLEKALRLSRAFGNPHERIRTIHVGGTNGKGSVSHSLASVLMAKGLKVGLYTSPHLVDYTERIRIDGQPISRKEVTDFVERFRTMNLTETAPSFFELTTIMAFDHFARHGVDVAVIEVGLGGRLDTTNIITPLLSVITNISYDHTALLGDTLGAIAGEKAGIIKAGIPAVIGRRHPETDAVFAVQDNVIFAPDTPMFTSCKHTSDSITYLSTPWGDIDSDLTGDCQPENMQTILTALKTLSDNGVYTFGADEVRTGLSAVCRRTGLMGRWMKLGDNPSVIADTAHNVDGWRLISRRLNEHNPDTLHVVIGFVSDKDYRKILTALPKDANYYFVRPSVNRAASSTDIAEEARAVGLRGNSYPSVAAGYADAIKAAASQRDAMVYVGGSTFVVADLLAEKLSGYQVVKKSGCRCR